MDSVREASERAARSAELIAQAAADAVDPVKIAERAAAVEEAMAGHYSRVIASWCNSESSEALCQCHLSLPIIGVLSEERLQEWELSLTLKGYTIVRRQDSNVWELHHAPLPA